MPCRLLVNFYLDSLYRFICIRFPPNILQATQSSSITANCCDENERHDAPSCFTLYSVLRVGFTPECVVCCIQVAYATNRTSTENWLQLRQLKRKEFSALGLINPSGRIGANLIFGSDYPVRRLANHFSRIGLLRGSIVVKATPIPEF